MAGVLEMKSPSVALLFGSVWLALFGASTYAETAAPPPPKPAALQISGYGILGNRELKRMLMTLELAGKKPQFFSASFVEDATLILASRVKRDGYLRPSIDVTLRLADGTLLRTNADLLIETPLPRPLRISSARFQIRSIFAKLPIAPLCSNVYKTCKIISNKILVRH